jgi:hypothetical protein
MRDYTSYELLRSGAEPDDYVVGAKADTAAAAADEEWSDDERAGFVCESPEWPNENTPVHWTRLAIGETTVLHVCSEGSFRIEGAPFYVQESGTLLSGTPFRTLTVEAAPGRLRTFFVHELVWRAFQGDLPPGFEVRHQAWAAEGTPYPNSLDALELRRKVVSPIDF